MNNIIKENLELLERYVDRKANCVNIEENIAIAKCIRESVLNIDSALRTEDQSTIDYVNNEVADILGLHENIVYGATANDNLYIGINQSDDRFKKAPYFKISWQRNFRNDDAVARINLKAGEYEIHNGHTVKVDPEIKSILTDLFKMPCEEKGFERYTIWDAMVKQVADLQGISFEEAQKQYPPIDFNKVDWKIPKGTHIDRWKGSSPKKTIKKVETFRKEEEKKKEDNA